MVGSFRIKNDQIVLTVRMKCGFFISGKCSFFRLVKTMSKDLYSTFRTTEQLRAVPYESLRVFNIVLKIT